MISLNVEIIYEKIMAACKPEDVFGSPEDDQFKVVKKEYRRLSKAIHPDLYPDSATKVLASEAFSKLTEFYELAQERINSGVYGTELEDDHGKVESGHFVIQTRAREYAITSTVATGDVSVVYGGYCISDDGENFERMGKGPIITSTLNEPFQFSGPKVRIFDDKLYMFYLAGEKWVLNELGNSESFYKIRLATSDDGLNWKRTGQNIIDSILEKDECQAGPDVFYYGGKYHMYFSYRYGLNFRGNNRGYRIGYAHSDNLFNWTRDDANVGIGLSETGWDSQSMHYPHIFECDGATYMLYNGNEFGRYGFGLGVLDEY